MDHETTCSKKNLAAAYDVGVRAAAGGRVINVVSVARLAVRYRPKTPSRA
jgi:hypothetical protein